MSKEIPVGIIGSGNIGTDLLVKITRSKELKCTIFAGQRPDSPGIAKAKEMGIKTSDKSLKAIISEIMKNNLMIVFDATNAQEHKYHSKILSEFGVFTIDLTPSRIGKLCVPEINLDSTLEEQEIDLGTCSIQAIIPIVDLIKGADYIEVVASIASKSAGMGTRNNIDEFTQTTAAAIRQFGQTKRSKSIFIINPAEPPITMHNTIFAKGKFDLEKLKIQLAEIETKMKGFVPGYKITLGPIIENERLIIMNEVEGRGDYLPPYAGNLDVINNAAIYVAEKYAQRKNNNY